MKKHPRYDDLREAMMELINWMPETYGMLLLQDNGRELVLIDKASSTYHHETLELATIATGLLPDIQMIQQKTCSEVEIIYVRYQRDDPELSYPDRDMVMILPVKNLAYLFIALHSHTKLTYPPPIEQTVARLATLLEETP